MNATITNAQGQIRTWGRSTAELVTRCVCVGCNTGWMSALENSTKSILHPMINGQDAILSGQQQDVIARWMIKTAMVLDSMGRNKEEIFYEEAEWRQFSENLLLPGHVAFWLGHYSGSYWGGFTSQRIFRAEGPVKQYRSYILTMAFGQLVMQFANSKISPPIDEYVAELPKTEDNWSVVEFDPHLDFIGWPPPGPSFNDSELTLLKFSERFYMV